VSLPFSIITCSIDRAKFERYEAMLQQRFSLPYELIKISDAQSLCEGYQRGAAQARGQYLIFCHDDIELLNSDFAAHLQSALKQFHLVGVAGTSKLTSGKWVASGFPFLHGHIAHGHPEGNSYTYINYGCYKDPALVAEIQALDGVFFAVRREVWEDLGFDDQNFDGFHLYDLDFSYRAFLAGYKLAVDYRLELLHFSSGSFDRTWNRYKYFFQKKFKGSLEQIDNRSLPYYISIPLSNLEVCCSHFKTARTRTCISFDPEEERAHFANVDHRLRRIESGFGYCYVPRLTTDESDDPFGLLGEICSRATPGAIIEWWCREAHWDKICDQKQTDQWMVRASRRNPEPYLILQVR
jgi:hypothetical protein